MHWIQFLFHAALIWASEPVWIAEGDHLRVPVEGAAWVENGQILKVEKIGGIYSILGLRVGSSDFRNGEQISSIAVISRKQLQTYSALLKVSAKSLGLSVKIENSQVVVSGNLNRISDWQKLSQECEKFQCHYLNRTQASSQLRKTLQSQMASELRQIAAFPYRLDFGDEIRLFVPEKFPQLQRIQNLMARYGIQVIPDASSIEILPMVKVQITIAEVRKTEMMKWGIQWPASYEAQLIPGTETINSPLNVALNALEASGVGRVLASPNLLCRSGKEAQFTAGGEIPIKIINFKLQDIIWKHYGILLKVKPQADFSGRMSIALETEVSSLDDAHKVDGIPGIFTNRVQSHFDLTKPQTILLSGLLKKDSSENSSGLPGLQNLPILGSLFSSKDFQDNRTELMIFVRPEIVSVENGGT